MSKFNGDIRSYLCSVIVHQPLHPEPFYLREEKERFISEIALQFTDGLGTKIKSFINGLEISSGKHEEGLPEAVIGAIRAYSNEEKYTAEDLGGVYIGIHIQSSSSLDEKDLNGIYANLSEGLLKYFKENPKTAQAILKQTELSYKAGEAARKAIKLNRLR